jgi:hypothetical protein
MPDRTIELNAEYAQFEAAIHDLSVPQLSLAAERLRQLLGLEPGEQFPGPTGAVASEREAGADIDTCWRRTRAAPINLNRGGLATFRRKYAVLAAATIEGRRLQGVRTVVLTRSWRTGAGDTDVGLDFSLSVDYLNRCEE